MVGVGSGVGVGAGVSGDGDGVAADDAAAAAVAAAVAVAVAAAAAVVDVVVVVCAVWGCGSGWSLLLFLYALSYRHYVVRSYNACVGAVVAVVFTLAHGHHRNRAHETGSNISGAEGSCKSGENLKNCVGVCLGVGVYSYVCFMPLRPADLPTNIAVKL